MLKDNYLNRDELEKETNRAGFGRGLVRAGELNENVVALSADLTQSTRTTDFEKCFPERFFQVGVAEQNLMGVGVGLSLAGKIPFVTSYAVFNPGRNWDQLRVSVCYSNANVKIVGSHAGFSPGPDGASHQALEDLALTRVLPNLTVLSPADSVQAEKATLAAAQVAGPVYLRLSRAQTPVFYVPEVDFQIGRVDKLRDGNDLTLIATGPLVYEALLASEGMKESLSVEVLNCSTIKPLDEEAILTSVRKTGRVVTLEEHQVAGGLGGAVAELLSEELPVPVIRWGVQDTFGESGTPEELWRKHGLDGESLAERLRRL